MGSLMSFLPVLSFNWLVIQNRVCVNHAVALMLNKRQRGGPPTTNVVCVGYLAEHERVKGRGGVLLSSLN